MPAKDHLFLDPASRSKDFEFNDSVATVFDDMVMRSVPFYQEIQHMICELSIRFSQENSAIYDLGCSTGTTLAQLSQSLQKPGISLIGIDNSPAMLRKAEERLSQRHYPVPVAFQCIDLHSPDLVLEKSSIIILNLSLQFIRPLYRDTLITKIYDALLPQGYLILIEKVLAETPELNRLQIDLYHEFKRREGYSEIEISQKREALENILIPYKPSENIELMNRNGFSSAELFFRWYNFAGFIGIKTE